MSSCGSYGTRSAPSALRPAIGIGYTERSSVKEIGKCAIVVQSIGLSARTKRVSTMVVAGCRDRLSEESKKGRSLKKCNESKKKMLNVEAARRYRSERWIRWRENGNTKKGRQEEAADAFPQTTGGPV